MVKPVTEVTNEVRACKIRPTKKIEDKLIPYHSRRGCSVPFLEGGDRGLSQGDRGNSQTWGNTERISRTGCRSSVGSVPEVKAAAHRRRGCRELAHG
eukprot:7641166-Pyramimonas_sp.AAC.1